MGDKKRINYQKYINSKEWKNLRKQVISRGKNVCEDCCTKEIQHVHHLTYARFGSERLDDLLGLCIECHQKHHPDKPFDSFAKKKPKRHNKKKRKKRQRAKPKTQIKDEYKNYKTNLDKKHTTEITQIINKQIRKFGSVNKNDSFEWQIRIKNKVVAVFSQKDAKSSFYGTLLIKDKIPFNSFVYNNFHIESLKSRLQQYGIID